MNREQGAVRKEQNNRRFAGCPCGKGISRPAQQVSKMLGLAQYDTRGRKRYAMRPAQQVSKILDSEKKIVLIDGYVASGKSTCLGLIKNILNDNFCYLPKYSTRLPRINENNGDVFCETSFLNECVFNEKNISHIYNKLGILYGMNLNDIDSYLNLRKNIFLVANDFFRKEIHKLYNNKYLIIKVFIQSNSEIRFNRILEADLGIGQKEQRLKRFHSNKERKMSDFDYIIKNESSMSFFNDEVSRLIDNLSGGIKI